MTAHSSFRLLTRTLAILSAITITLALLLILINLFDEDLHPETAALLVPPPASVPAGHNSFYALYALGVPAAGAQAIDHLHWRQCLNTMLEQQADGALDEERGHNPVDPCRTPML